MQGQWPEETFFFGFYLNLISLLEETKRFHLIETPERQ